ncbi:MarR family winged helix-turn-helix transcriptional regulator [Alteromonas sp. a30]|uniref:MarR family winged helix-turn-helix transcriptional regulator n=1 Tax=Alteromonas sp. a30 TaxID=2730917 RepID=UPI0022820DB1|nr:MarR family winged helix-turn-helix transcriptional regulator [Alteromonas sp. a30]MCY7294080.1 winged helix-turn-helix transcriptional regulator [Alteromonas sp. a30]
MGKEICFHLKLRQADRMLTNYYDAYLRELGIKITQFSILRCLWYYPASPHNLLEKKLIINQTTLTRNLKSLVKAGYVESHPSEQDQRVKLLSLGEKGKSLYLQALQRWNKAQEEVYQQLGEKLSSQLFDVSDNLVSLKDRKIQGFV